MQYYKPYVPHCGKMRKVLEKSTWMELDLSFKKSRNDATLFKLSGPKNPNRVFQLLRNRKRFPQ